MRDSSPLIIGGLALVTAVVALLWCLGRAPRRVPTCRACGRDARAFAWREPSVCDCGAALNRRRAVHFPRVRSRRLAIISIALFGATVLFAWWDTQVRASGAGWMDTLPTRIYAFALARGWDEPQHLSAWHRLAEQPPLDEVARLRDAALELWSTEIPRSTETWRLVMWTAAMAVPTGKSGDRFAAAMPESIDVIAEQVAAGIAVELRPVVRHPGAIRSLMLRIDEVRIGDRVVPFTIVRDEPRRGRAEVDRTGARLWHPVVGMDREGALRLLIRDESIASTGPEAVRVIGEAAYASELLNALLSDDVIATSRDPAAWGVPIASGPLAQSAAPPPGRKTPVGMSESVPGMSASWSTPGEYRSMPAVVGIPVVRMASSGALAGALLVLALAGTAAAWRGPMRLSPPACRRCGALLRGPLRDERETLPPCCPECGRAVTSIDDCRCVVRYRRWPLALLVLIVVASGSVWLMPRASRWIEREYRARFASPEQEAAWLVRAAVEARPTPLGPIPAHRLASGWLDSTAKRDWIENPSANRSAARALLMWWRTSSGELPASPTDPDTTLRRSALAIYLQQAVAARAMSVTDARPIAAWCGDLAPGSREMSLDWVIRAGERIRPMPGSTGSWRWPPSLVFATPEAPGTIDVDVVVSRPLPAPESDPLFDRVLRGRVHVLPADAPMALTGPVLAELVPTLALALRVRAGGTRSAVQLSQPPATWGYLSWQGRWEVLTSDSPDAEPCVVMRGLPTVTSPAALGTLPLPLPQELIVRFVPELPETAFTSTNIPGGTPEFLCGERVTFRLRRSGEEDHDSSRVVVYRTALPE